MWSGVCFTNHFKKDYSFVHQKNTVCFLCIQGLCWDWQNRPLVTHKHLVQCQGLIGCFVSEKGVERIAFECKVIRSLFQTPQPNTSRPLFAVLGHIWSDIVIPQFPRWSSSMEWDGWREIEKKHKTQNLLKNRSPKAGRLVALLEERKEVTRGTQKPRRIITS